MSYYFSPRYRRELSYPFFIRPDEYFIDPFEELEQDLYEQTFFEPRVM